MDTDKNAQGCYNNDVKGVTTDIFKFEEIIRCDLLYVDKTKYIYDLVGSMDRRFFFLSRPRRFGKSLFCSTLHALFDGRKDFFKGLYIAEETDYSFEKYPVIHLDFSSLTLTDEGSVLSDVQFMLMEAGRLNGIDVERDTPYAMLHALITRAMEKTGKPVVIIIDEFDSPFTSEFGSKPELIEYMRKLFNGLYKTIKADSGYIRFFFITGCVKLANLSIFSAMNNLKDISMDSRFAGAFGYTDEEVDRFFGEGIDENWERCGYSAREDFIKAIKDYYDGYRFSPDSETRVYNPVSIGSFFSDGCVFDNYWEDTGVSTMAVELAKRYDITGIDTEDMVLLKRNLATFDISRLSETSLSKGNVLALLYYSGYLTIAEPLPGGAVLGFPNIEIASTFMGNLAELYGSSDYEVGKMIVLGTAALVRGDTAGMIASFNEFCRQCSSSIVRERHENPYHMMAHMFFVSCGCRVASEDSTAIGRIDLTVEKEKSIYVMELKVDGSAEEALRQIRDRDYAGKYIDYSRRHGLALHTVGISFLSGRRCIEEWKEEIIS